MMNIGFDAKRAFHNKTGLGNYSRSIIETLERFYPQNSYFLFNPKPSSLFHPEGLSTQEVRPRHFFKRLHSVWRSFFLVRETRTHQLSIFHGLSNELPYGIQKGKTKWVLTVHDLIFLRCPQFFKPVDRFIYKAKLSYACKKADKIIAVSNQTKRDLMDYLNVPDDLIEVVYQGCNPIFKQSVGQQEKNAVRDKYKLPDRYLLNVGTVEPRKNLLVIVRALKNVPEEIHLTVVGRLTDYVDTTSSKLQKRVHFLTNVPMDDLPAIYQQAEIFIYPSKFEGFGIPVLEALSSRVPVIAATGSCLEEAGGSGSCYIHPEDEQKLAFYINSIISNEEKKKEMIMKGLQHASQFSDQSIADKLINIYQKAALGKT